MAHGDRVFLTGATGFIGCTCAARVASRRLPGASSRSRPQRHPELDDRVEHVAGDMRRVGGFARALEGCRYLVHCAALYSFAPRDRTAIHAINVDGTASLMLAAHVGGVERAVLTSSSATEGHARTGYHRSKLEQERAAFAGRVPLIALLPTAPVGPGDAKPTPTGRLVLDFARGKIVALAPGHGGMNLVAVEDVARAHVAALERGKIGERYVLGGENLGMDEIWKLLAEVTGKSMPAWRAPFALALAASYVDEMRCRITGATPAVPLEGVRLSRERMYADSSKAQRELDYSATPVRAALERAVTWYRETGRVKN